MAGGRRNSSKSGCSKAQHVEDRSSNTNESENQVLSQLSHPKHVPLPDIPTDSELLFEIVSLLFGSIALGSQYLNLYRTVWWLPHSHTEYALNFYLINPHEVLFCIILIGRRLQLSLFKKFCFKCLPTSLQVTGLQISRIFVISTEIPFILWCSYYILLQHGTLSVFCLGYPVIVYLILFGPTILPLFELQSSSQERAMSPKSRAAMAKSGILLMNHVCSVSAEVIREEVEMLKTDFNGRLKQVLFNSLSVAYYCGFVPCCFVQNTLYYDLTWVAQHVGFVWLSSFTMYIVFCFPPRYCDTLHRAALHLGRWQKVEMRNTLIPYNVWSDSTIWHQGALVKYTKELFRAEGISNAAEPGNLTHTRFYAIFSNPMGALSSLLGLQITLVGIQLVVLIRSYEWNHIISIALLLLLNFLTLFKIARQYLVLGKIYHIEQLSQERVGG
ncbi:transmembrane protein 39A [Centruroides vittatus]|uniref:transmembrane protein 39A n=1 Tax=Centruroides vittatus TaxID=120091 RepID=UPI00350FA1EF